MAGLTEIMTPAVNGRAKFFLRRAPHKKKSILLRNYKENIVK
jgi:hypothetical protein